MSGAPNTYHVILSARLLEFLYLRLTQHPATLGASATLQTKLRMQHLDVVKHPDSRPRRTPLNEDELLELQALLTIYTSNDYRGVISRGERRACFSALQNVKMLLNT